ncbi:MAG: hypothetical protein ACYTAN_09415 [Planctomycetota bacterium]|jgi:hypothetical protein
MARREGPPRFLTAALYVISIILLLLAGYGVWWLISGLGAGLDESAARRSRDVAIVRAQKEAGEKYKEHLTLTMELTPPAPSENRALLDFTIANSGDKHVLKAVAEVSFATTGGERRAEKVILFDDSPTSVRPDKRLGAGETRAIVRNIEVAEDWDLKDVRYTLSEVRIETEQP